MSGPVTFRRVSRVLWRRIGPEVLIADPRGTEISSLSSPASAAWLMLDHPRRREDLVEELAARFGDPVNEVATHVERLLDELEQRGWVTRTDDDA